MLEPTLDVGFKQYVLVDKIVGIVNSKTASSKRMLKETKHPVIDATMNRACLALVILNNGMLVKSALPRIRLGKRLVSLDKEPEIQLPKKQGKNLKRKDVETDRTEKETIPQPFDDRDNGTD